MSSQSSNAENDWLLCQRTSAPEIMKSLLLPAGERQKRESLSGTSRILKKGRVFHSGEQEDCAFSAGAEKEVLRLRKADCMAIHDRYIPRTR